MYKAAVIGCGRIGSGFESDAARVGIYSHAGAYVSCPYTQLVALCDVDKLTLRRAGEKWKVANLYDNYKELLSSSDCEIVSVCTPDETHAPIIAAAIKTHSVKAVLAEKPLALSARDAASLVELSREYRCALVVNYSRRFDPAHQRIRSEILDGRLGEIRYVGGCYYGGIIHIGTHWIDLARFLIGEILTVRGLAQTVADCDLQPAVRLEFATGAEGYLQPIRRSEFSIFEMDIIGSRGRVRIIDSGHSFEWFMLAESPFYSGFRTLRRIEGPTACMRDLVLRAVENTVDVIEGRAPPACSGEDAVTALRIAEAALESARNGGQQVSWM